MSRLYTDAEISRLERRLCCVKEDLEALQDQINIGAVFPRVENYSALPDASDFSGAYFHVENSQGTKWLPGPLGGTFYSKGFYYSNGTSWVFVGDIPYNATQAEVDAGIVTDKFVTPNTLANSTLLSSKIDGTGLATYVPYFTDANTIAASGIAWDQANQTVGIGTAPLANVRTVIRGPGSTSATTALRVENSNGTQHLLIRDDGRSFLFADFNLGYGNGTENNNTAYGRLAMNAAITGVNNTAVGREAMRNTTSGNSNAAFGANALITNTGGSNNVAIGLGSLFFNTTGGNNTALGSAALQNMTTGSNNLGMSRDAGFNWTIAQSCIAIGHRSARLNGDGSNSTNATRSIFVGEDTAPLANAQINQIVIGSPSTGLGSNTTRIGNSSTTHTHLDGKLTIGTNTTPAASAIADFASTTQGFLPPRGTTAQMNAIVSPAEGLMFYDTTVKKLHVYDGTTWQPCW